MVDRPIGIRLAVGSILWLLLISSGMGWWMVYDRTPGASAGSPGDWPKSASMVLNPESGAVVMFVHPHCPCTGASLDKLDAALATVPRKPSVYIVVSPIDDDPKQTCASANYRRAASIAGATCIVDFGRAAQVQFGAATSGQILYFNSRGNLKYAGGLTIARGGVAPCDKEELFRAVLRGEIESPVLMPVFGCPL